LRYEGIEAILARQVNAEAVGFASEPVSDCINVVVQKDKLFIETAAPLDTSSQLAQLQKDLEYYQGFLSSVERKLSNEKFVQNAKAEVVEIERKKKADAEAKIRAIEESLGNLSGKG
jgi:valyl-tRNA synthetase